MKKILNTILDILFPFSEKRKRIESLSAEELLQKCERAETCDDKNSYSIFSYETPLIRETVHFLKYKRNKKIASIFAEILYSELLEKLSEMKMFKNFDRPVLIPIPISKVKRRKRGFNQIELVLEEFKKLDTQNFFEINFKSLIKIKETKSQTEVRNRRRRMENIRNCFGVINEEKIAGRNIILIDDVLTTGATMREAKNVLLKSGARRVLCLTMAH